MKRRSLDALVSTDPDVEGVAAERAPSPTVETYRVVAVTRPLRGLVGLTTVRIRQPSGQTTDVQGYGLPDALRRLALLIESEQGYVDVRQTAREAIIAAAGETARLAQAAQSWRADAEMRRRFHPGVSTGIDAPPAAELDPSPKVTLFLQRTLVRLKVELGLDEELPATLAAAELEETPP